MNAMNEQPTCRCCGGRFSLCFDVPSRRTPDWRTFRYGECAECGSLTLTDDVDPAPFYDDYFSHRERPVPATSRRRGVLGAVAQRTVMAAAPGAAAWCRVANRPEWLRWFAGSGLSLRSPVLDVGSGAGALLYELRRWGFIDLTGCDPFLTENSEPAPGLRLLRCTLDAVERDDFGMIIFHHSLEHVDDPLAMLLAARERLRGRGSRVVVAVPVAQGPVWAEYRDNWAALDAPLHRWVPTMEGLRCLARRAGFDVGRVTGTCDPYHLVGSEMNARRIPSTVDSKSVLSGGELRDLQRRARGLTDTSDAPQLSVVLTPRSDG